MTGIAGAGVAAAESQTRIGHGSGSSASQTAIAKTALTTFSQLWKDLIVTSQVQADPITSSGSRYSPPFAAASSTARQWLASQSQIDWPTRASGGIPSDDAIFQFNLLLNERLILGDQVTTTAKTCTGKTASKSCARSYQQSLKKLDDIGARLNNAKDRIVAENKL